MFEAKRFQTNPSKAAAGPCGEGGGRAGLFCRAWGEQGVERWEQFGGGRSWHWGVCSRQETPDTSPLHVATRGSAHMEMAPLENSGPFSRVKCHSTILCLCGQFSLSACAVSPRYTDNKSGGGGFFFKFSFIN